MSANLEEDNELNQIINSLESKNKNAGNDIKNLKPAKLNLLDEKESIEHVEVKDKFFNSKRSIDAQNKKYTNNYSNFYYNSQDDWHKHIKSKYHYNLEGEEPRIYKKKIDEKGEIEKRCNTKEEFDNAMFVYEVGKLHPRRWKGENGLEKFECCVQVGCFGCGREQLESELTEYGIEVMVYFRTLKALIYTFLYITVLYALLFYFYAGNNSDQPSYEIKDFINKLSIGNSISTYHMCNKIPIGNFYSVSDYYFNITCEASQIIRTGFFGLTGDSILDTENQDNCINYSSGPIINLDSACDLSSWLYSQYNQSCSSGKSFCFFPSEKSQLPSCGYDQILSKYLYLTYSCTDNFLRLSINNSYLLLLEGIIDGLSVIGFLICAFVIFKGQKHTEHIYNKHIQTIGNFTVRLHNLGLTYQNFYSQLNFLILHVNRVLKLTETDIEREKLNNNNMLIHDSVSIIYEINYPLFHHKIMDMYIRKDQLYTEYKEILSKFEEAKRGTDNVTNYEDKLKEMKAKIAKHLQKIKHCLLYDIEHIDDVFITFKEVRHAAKFARMYNKNKMTRCCLICFGKKERISHMYFNDRWLDVEYDPESPSNIKWENLGYSKFRRCCRKFSNWIFCFFMFLCGLGVVLLLRNELEQVDNEFVFHTDCRKIDISSYTISTLITTTGSSKTDIQTFCFCLNLYNTQGYTITSNYTHCAKWSLAYSNLSLIYYIVVIGIPVLNLVSRIILKILSHCERNKSVVENKISLFSKLFFVLFMNSSANFLLMNMYLPQISKLGSFIPIFNGLYKDFDYSWYLNIGTIITLSLCINILEPHFVNLIHALFYCIFRLRDSRNLIGRNSKKKTKKSFQDLYLGPEFNIEIRYANIISSICVCLLYTSAIPILYPIILISLFVYYWMDKWLFLKYFKSPPLQKNTMSNIFLILLLIGVSVHCLFGIWIHGNYASLYNTGFIDLVLEKLLSSFNYILLALFAGLIIFLIFKFTCWEFLFFCMCKKCADESTIVRRKTNAVKRTIESVNKINNEKRNDFNSINEIKIVEEFRSFDIDKEIKSLEEVPDILLNGPMEYENIFEENKQSNPDYKYDKDFEKENINDSFHSNKIKELDVKLEIERYNSETSEEFNIYEALPLTTVYKNYTVRKLQFVKAQKLSHEFDLRFLIDLYKKNIDNDRKVIGIKLSYITGNDYYYIDNFDEKIKNIMSKYNDNELALISKDQSYSLAYIPKFESLLYSEYLKD